jgi:hypothetical protein
MFVAFFMRLTMGKFRFARAHFTVHFGARLGHVIPFDNKFFKDFFRAATIKQLAYW